MLAKLAADRRLASRADQLKALADALDTRTDADRWAAVDLFAAFPPDDTVSRGRGVWGARCFDILVQVLFFAPIFVTWLGLLHATTAYRQLVRIKRFSGESFLYGWQTGFDGRLPRAYYLDQIAVDVVFIIGLLVITVIVQSVYRSRSEYDVPAMLRRDLVAALTTADLELAAYRLSSPGHVAAELKKAAVEFEKTATAIHAVGETARQTQAAAKSSVVNAGTALSKVEALAKAATSAAGDVSKAATGLGQHVADVGAKTGQLVQAQNDFAKVVGDSSKQLAGSATGLTGSMTGVGTQMKDAVEASQRRLEAAVDGSAAKIASALSTGADQVGQALTQVATVGTGYAHRVETAADLIGQAGDSVHEMARLIPGLQTSISDLSGRIGAFESTVVKAAAAVPSAEDLAPGLRTAIGDLKAAAAALEAAAATLRTDARAFRRSPAGRPPEPAPEQPPAVRVAGDGFAGPSAPKRADPSAQPESPVTSQAPRKRAWRRLRALGRRGPREYSR